MMKKRVFATIMCIVMLVSILSACGNSAQSDVTTKEVIFLNRIEDSQPKNMGETGFTGLWHVLEFDEEMNPNALYAYQVDGILESDKEEMLNLLQEEGLLFLQDYPGSGVVVVGTMEILERIFLTDEKFKGYYFGAEAVVRPDMEEILKESCNGKTYLESMYSKSWFDKNFEELVTLLETDKNRVSLPVSVSSSWESIETD